jgi:formate hydrogenlyase transcriptional activator
VDWNDVDTIRLLQLAIEALPSGIVLVNPWGVIALVNREAELQFGYPREELLGQHLERLLPDAGPAFSAQTEGAASDLHGIATDVVTRTMGVRRDGTRFPLELRLKAVQTGETTSLLATVVDCRPATEDNAARTAVLEEQLAIERLSAELSNEFSNLSDHDLSAAVERGLSRTCEQIGLEGAAFCRLTAEGTAVELVSWEASGEPLDGWAPDHARFPWTLARALAGELVALSSLSDVPNEVDRRSFEAAGIRSALIVPLPVDGHIAGTLCFVHRSQEWHWSAMDIGRLRLVASVFDHVVVRLHHEEALRGALAEVKRLKEELQVGAAALPHARRAAGPGRGVSESVATRRVTELIEQVASTDSTVLLLGETGTGKELFASQIHELGPRRHRPMVRVNCAAIPSTLIESELFGREKGAFTGALARQIGRFELADHATIFLDEIGDLPLDVQVKLLRVLEEGQIERLGSPRSITIDTRIIAATHQDLQQRIAEGAFREDLFYRLNVFPIRVPALRERVEDIPHLIWHFVGEFSKAFGRRIESISNESLAALQQYPWPGNIRELRNTVERAMIVSTGPRLTIAVPPPSNAAARRSLKLVDIEKQHLRAVLESTHWKIRGEGGAATRLGLKPTTLETRMAKLGLKRPEHR